MFQASVPPLFHKSLSKEYISVVHVVTLANTKNQKSNMMVWGVGFNGMGHGTEYIDSHTPAFAKTKSYAEH
jgi:hypothetical protein